MLVLRGGDVLQEQQHSVPSKAALTHHTKTALFSSHLPRAARELECCRHTGDDNSHQHEDESSKVCLGGLRRQQQQHRRCVCDRSSQDGTWLRHHKKQ